MRQLGITMANQLRQISSVSTSLTTETLESSSTAVNFYSAIGTQTIEETTSLLTSLSALANRVSGAVELSSDSWRRLSNHVASNFQQSVNGVTQAQTTFYNNQNLSPLSNPASFIQLSGRIDNGEIYENLGKFKEALYLVMLGHMQQNSNAQNDKSLQRLSQKRFNAPFENVMLVPPYRMENESLLQTSFSVLNGNNVQNLTDRIQAQTIATVISRHQRERDISVASDHSQLAYLPLTDPAYQNSLVTLTEAGLAREVMSLQQKHNALLIELNALLQQENLLKAVR